VKSIVEINKLQLNFFGREIKFRVIYPDIETLTNFKVFIIRIQPLAHLVVGRDEKFKFEIDFEV
jgi:hypothetical protein